LLAPTLFRELQAKPAGGRQPRRPGFRVRVRIRHLDDEEDLIIPLIYYPARFRACL